MNGKDDNQNLFVSGKKMVGESLSYLRPIRYEDYKQKPKDFITLPIRCNSASKFVRPTPVSYYEARVQSKPNINRDFLTKERNRINQLKRANARAARQKAKIPDWANPEITTSSDPKKDAPSKVKLISKYTRVQNI